MTHARSDATCCPAPRRSGSIESAKETGGSFTKVFDEELRVLVVRVADRKEVYNDAMIKQLKQRLRAALAE